MRPVLSGLIAIKRGLYMRSEKKGAYQANLIERLKSGNKDLEREIEACRREIRYKDSLLAQAEKELAALKRRYEEYMSGYAERVEELAEAKREYEKASAEMKALIRRYKKEAEEEIERIRKAVV